MTFDPHPNLLQVTITATPSSPTSNTTLEISNADRTALLAVVSNPTTTPLNGSLHPASSPTPANTEIVRLTAVGAADSSRSGYATITVVRNAETGGQTGHSVLATDIIEFTITAKIFTDIETPLLSLGNFIVSGLTIPTSASLAATSVLGVIWYGGQKIAIASDGGHTYTASKDTYVDISNAGVYTYIPVTIGTAAPSLTANSIRIAKVVTNGSAITSVIQTGIDSLGNFIYPTYPLQSVSGLIGYAQVIAGQSGIDTGGADLTGLAVTVNVPSGRRIKIFANIQSYGSAVAQISELRIHEGATQLQSSAMVYQLSGTQVTQQAVYISKDPPTPGSHTYKLILMKTGGSGSTINLFADATFPAFISVELI